MPTTTPAPPPLTERPTDVLPAAGEGARGVGAGLLAGGLVGAVVSLELLLDKLALLADPAYGPPCSIDPVLSCGTIVRTEQAAVLGVPNPVCVTVANLRAGRLGGAPAPLRHHGWGLAA